MEAVENSVFVSVEEYLAGELESEMRHEYLGGTVYAMAGASRDHNTVAGNLFSALRSHLHGKPCRTFISDIKVRLRIGGDDIMYYPDVMVTCDPRDTDRYFSRFPKVLIEVLSPETERTDRREKFLSYTQIETLEEYVLVAQDKMEVTVFRRANKWQPEIANKPDLQLRLPSLDFALPLSAVYEGVKV
ncbi:MAG: Uma2 family endonuclease [Verrucomicrobia bacterium]|nr:Uma2 family endonuclease [Verrucomicrobiota bacterium]